MYETQAEVDAFFKCLYQFKPIRKLGEGSFGIAVLVYDDVEKIQKVFKLPKDQRTTESLLKEGENLRKLAELSHPHIIRLHQYGKVVMEWDGREQERYYINMAFGGTSLRAKLGDLRFELDENGNAFYHGSGRRMALEEALRISIEVCDGLDAAHGFRGASVRMLHRDISPDNILIDEETGTARIMDFGISRVIERSSALASFAGKLLYMDPECFKGRATFQSDLYSLGIVMYEMLTGELPYQSFEQRLEGPPRPPCELVPEVPEALSAIILRTLENDLAARFNGAAELLSDLRKVSARLNPLPPEYARLSDMPDGRLLCADHESGKRVAIRLALTNAAMTEFARQCAVLESLNLPHVDVPLRHFSNEEYVGIVSSAMRKESLAERFRDGRKGLADLEELCEIVAAVGDILANVHQQGLCHGYLSPYAIELTQDRQPRLHEVGNSPIFRARRFSGHSAESLEGFLPVAAYLSPQILCARQDPGPKDDIYSLGAILYVLATGRSPVNEADQRRVMSGDAVAETPCHPRQANELVAPSLADVIVKSLQWNPHDRFESVAEMAKAIRACKWPEDAIGALIDDALATYPPGGSDDELLKSCAILDRILLADPGNAQAHYARGVVYFRHGSYRSAVDEMERVADIVPDQELLHVLAQSYERYEKQYSKAIETYRKALEFGENPVILDHLAHVYMADNRKETAISTMQRSIELEDDASLRERRRVVLEKWTGDSSAPSAEDGSGGGSGGGPDGARRDDSESMDDDALVPPEPQS